uniref:Uncharacterized protein n=1 Tax=viral metagenome TaxID=1070528 RepID=A0A6M3XZM9_9ZZZZ
MIKQKEKEDKIVKQLKKEKERAFKKYNKAFERAERLDKRREELLEEIEEAWEDVDEKINAFQLRTLILSRYELDDRFILEEKQ